MENAFGALKAAPMRLGMSDHPSPSSPALIGDYYPRAKHIVCAVAKLLDISHDTIEPLCRKHFEMGGELFHDVPDSSFRGPF